MDLTCEIKKYSNGMYIVHSQQVDISVFNLKERTNCSLESSNAAMGRRFPKRGNFFRFLSLLLNEEFAKRKEMEAVCDGRKERKRKRTVDRDAVIEEATQLLMADEITVNQFLSRLIFENVCQPTALEYENDESFQGNSSEENDEEEETSDGSGLEDEEGEKTSASQFGCSSQVNTCLFCQTNEPNTLFLPCKHLKSCDECFKEFEKKTAPPLRCPICRVEIKNTIVVFK